MRDNNLIERMYEDRVLDNQWSLAEQLCAAIKQNRDNKTIINSFESLKNAYQIEALALFKSDPISADYVKNSKSEKIFVDAVCTSSIIKAIFASVCFEMEDKDAVIAAIQKIASYYNEKPETGINKWFTAAINWVDFDRLKEIQTQEDLVKMNRANESVIFWSTIPPR